MYMYRAITIGPLQGLNALKRYTICNKLKQFVKLSFVCKSATNVGFAFQGKKKSEHDKCKSWDSYKYGTFLFK